jgi:amino acid adenylation domain-containing protein
MRLDRNRTIAIHRLFEARAASAPKHMAVSGPGTLTYEELNERANNLARLLRNMGIKPGTVVGILVERSLEMITGIFGILKAGGAYLPISPDNPARRVAHLLRDSGANVLLTQAKFLDRCAEVDLGPAVRIVNLEAEEIYRQPTDNLPLFNEPGDPVYVIYTSGSTGTPKGVVIEHRSLVNRLAWMQRAYPLGPADTVLQKTPFFFDVSVWEMFWWSTAGARVCFLMPGGERFPQAIVETVEKNRITVMHFVPSMLSVFLEYLRHSADDVKRLASLKRIFASGEALTPAHVKAFNEILHRQNGTLLTNLYGPTEATVDVSYFDCPTAGDFEKIPIGQAIDNISLPIMNKDLQPQPAGKEGELCIAGIGVARGYLNRPELTAEKFVNLAAKARKGTKSSNIPLFQHSIIPEFKRSGKLYRTGDLARIGPDGNIEFLGRQDQQVKIHGLRIELGEIESVLSGHPSIQDCVVVVKKFAKNITMIAAYIIPQAGETLTTGELKSYLKTLLPDYMVPNLFVTMERFPLTASGKLDRSALPEPSF